MKNNIAILILAHHNKELLSKIINHLASDFDVYVQIDKKSSLEIKDLPNIKNGFYFKEIAVYWGGFSQIENMHFILEKAHENNHEHYIIISGDDIPIKSNSYIKGFFKENKNKNFMYATKLPIKTWGFNGGLDRVERYWFMNTNSRIKVKILSRLTLIFQKVFGIKIKLFDIDFYGGSNWLNISHQSLTYVFNFISKNPDYLKKLKYSRATDEIWLQSILMNSPYKDLVIKDDLRYIDWETGPDFPRVLTIADYSKVKESKALFARKVNQNVDNEIIDTILGALNEQI